MKNIVDNVIMQARIWKHEARCHHSTVCEIYQIITGSTGEPGTWNGAKPVRKRIDELEFRINELESENSRLNQRNMELIRSSKTADLTGARSFENMKAEHVKFNNLKQHFVAFKKVAGRLMSFVDESKIKKSKLSEYYQLDETLKLIGAVDPEPWVKIDKLVNPLLQLSREDVPKMIEIGGNNDGRNRTVTSRDNVRSDGVNRATHAPGDTELRGSAAPDEKGAGQNDGGGGA